MRGLLFSIHIRKHLCLYSFPNDKFHTSGFLGQDTDVMKLDTVTQVYAVLSYDWSHKIAKFRLTNSWPSQMGSIGNFWHILEVSGKNLGRIIYYPEIFRILPQFLQTTTAAFPILSLSLNAIRLSYHSTQKNCRTWSMILKIYCVVTSNFNKAHCNTIFVGIAISCCVWNTACDPLYTEHPVGIMTYYYRIL